MIAGCRAGGSQRRNHLQTILELDDRISTTRNLLLASFRRLYSSKFTLLSGHCLVVLKKWSDLRGMY